MQQAGADQRLADHQPTPRRIGLRAARSRGCDQRRQHADLVRGVLVRHFTLPRIAQYNRITIGTPAQMEILLAAVRDILSEREHEA